MRVHGLMKAKRAIAICCVTSLPDVPPVVNYTAKLLQVVYVFKHSVLSVMTGGSRHQDMTLILDAFMVSPA